MSQSALEVDPEKGSVELLYIQNESSKSSGTESPMEVWSSLLSTSPLLSYNPKKELQAEGLYSPGSGEICAKHTSMSASSVFRHPYYNYPAVLDPGIKEALLETEPPRPPYSDDGKKLYLDLCKESNVCPIRIFYSNLLNNEINLKFYCPDFANIRLMARALQHNHHVKRLDLTDCALDIDACYHLGRMLRDNKTIEELILDSCRIKEAGLRRLGAHLNVNITLKTLSLAKNELTDEGGEIFAEMIDSGGNIRATNLSYNKLGRKTAYALAESLNYKNYFTHIDLSWNLFVHIGSTVKLLKAIAETSEFLQELNLSFVGFETTGQAQAIANITLIPSLKILNLSDNRFADSSAPILVSKLPDSELRVLNLSNNLFSPLGAGKIIEVLLNPSVKIQKLFLDNICVDRNFMDILQRIQQMKIRNNLVLTHDKVLHDWVAVGEDPRKLLLRRGDYMGKMKKNNPKDVPMFLYSLSYATDYIRAKEMIVMMKSQKIPVNDDWVHGLIEAFPGPVVDKKRTIDAKKMREYIRRLWPDLRLPPNWKPPVMIRVDVKNKKKAT